MNPDKHLNRVPLPGTATECALLFLRIGATAFGGPAAHLVRMRREFVTERAWLNEEEFADLVAAANLVPGPASTEVAMAIGYRRAGWAGLVAAGVCFILPAALATLGFAVLYHSAGRLAWVEAALQGARPAICAIVLAAAIELAMPKLRDHKHARKNLALILIAIIVAYFIEQPILVLLGVGALSVATVLISNQGGSLPPLSKDTSQENAKDAKQKKNMLHATVFGVVLLAVMAGTSSLSRLFLIFLRLGTEVFGSGYVLLSFLRTELVTHTHLVSEQQIYDAVAVGQLTPGPIFASATFLGYLLNGFSGALVATVGIFLPAFLLAAVVARFAGAMHRSQLAAGFLNGVAIAAFALMLVVACQMGRAVVHSRTGAAILAVSIAALISRRINSAWLLLVAALVGVLASLVSH